MNIIEFQNNQYKLREVDLPEMGVVLVSTISLNQILLTDERNCVSDEAISLDNAIYYFVDDNEIEISDEDLITLLNIEVK